MLLHVLDLGLGRRAVLLRLGEDHLGELLLTHLGLLVIGKLVEDDLRLEGVGGTLLDLGPEVFLGLGGLVLGVLEVLLHRQAGAGQLLDDLLLAGGDLGLQQGGGDLEVDAGDDGLEDLVASIGGLLEAGHLLEAATQVGAHLVGGVELADHLGELVVDGGELLLLNLGDSHLDLGVLVAVGAAQELRGEGLALADLEARDGLVHAVEHAAGAELVLDALGGGVLEGLAVLRTLQVDGDDVAILGGAVDIGVRGEALGQGADTLLDVLVLDLGGLDLDRDVGEGRELEVGTNVDLGGEGHLLAVLELGHLDLGLTQGDDLVLDHGLAVGLGQCIVDGLLQHHAATEALVDDGRRHLALAEAGDRHLLGDLAVGLVQARLQFGEGHVDGELHPGRAELLNGAGHSFS